nr:uncharacterized tRNA/rRNA methyltransferase slr1673 [Ipomoea batatas]
MKSEFTFVRIPSNPIFIVLYSRFPQLFMVLVMTLEMIVVAGWFPSDPGSLGTLLRSALAFRWFLPAMSSLNFCFNLESIFFQF